MRRGIAVLLVIISTFVLITTGFAGGLEGTVTASVLYVREQSYSESDTIHLITLGEKVSILAKVDEWYYVTCQNGTKGYVYAQFISIATTDSSSTSGGSATSGAAVLASSKASSSSTTAQTGDGSKTTAVSSASLPSLTRIGDRGTNVTAIQQALLDYGYFSSAVDGIFGQLTYQAVRKFQKENGLVVDGIVGKATISALFGDTTVATQDSGAQSNVKSASSTKSPTAQVWDQTTAEESSSSSTAVASNKSTTKSLDWFDEGYSLISKNKNITIYDLNTGVVWNAKYINGKRHADIIPASSSDAKKITSSNIVGSYVRRPVIVTIAGSNYAGSMYAVGHGEDSYCDYFKGVMCIHFTGSQTHGTQKVDADHQKAIEVALKASI